MTLLVISVHGDLPLSIAQRRLLQRERQDQARGDWSGNLFGGERYPTDERTSLRRIAARMEDVNALPTSPPLPFDHWPTLRAARTRVRSRLRQTLPSARLD